MRRLTTLAVLPLVFASFVVLVPTGAARAQTTPQSEGSGVAPDPAGSVASQTGEAREARRALHCQGCHGPGRTLPYLAGSLFHADEHRAYDSGFHARAPERRRGRTSGRHLPRLSHPLPCRKDAADLRQSLLYYTGLGRTRMRGEGVKVPGETRGGGGSPGGGAEPTPSAAGD